MADALLQHVRRKLRRAAGHDDVAEAMRAQTEAINGLCYLVQELLTYIVNDESDEEEQSDQYLDLD